MRAKPVVSARGLIGPNHAKNLLRKPSEKNRIFAKSMSRRPKVTESPYLNVQGPGENFDARRERRVTRVAV